MQNNKINKLLKHIISFKNTIILVVVFLGLGTGTISAQQEPQYSQYMFNLLNINPAYAGNREVHNITLLYRNQWTGIEGAPRTGTLSWDHRSTNSNVGYGIQVGNDKLGVENTTFLKGFYSYRIPFKNSSLSLGIDAGVLNYRADYTKINTSTSGDPLFQDNVNKYMPRVGVGGLYESDRFYIGLSVPDLLNTKVVDNDELVHFVPKPHFYLNGGVMFDLSQSIKLKPSLLVKAVSGAPIQCDINLNSWFNNTLGFGLSYRTNDAIIGSFELQLAPFVRLGYAYDYSINRLKTYNNSGTHEIMLRFEFNNGNSNKDKVLSPRYY